MAKAVATKKTHAVAPGTAGALPAHLASKMAEHAGKGVSTDQADNLIPLIYVLQPLSPQVNKRNPAYIKDAEPGDIWLRNYQDPIVKGEEGIIFQPCFFSKDWVEWVPRDDGGGFVARHDELPKDAKLIEDDKGRKKYVRPNGHEVIETRYHAGYVYTDTGPVGYVIPLTSTGHTVSRDWMFRMNNKQLPSGEKAPSWAFLYRLKTKERSNAAGTWFTYEIQEEGWVQTEEDLDRGFQLHNAFATGAKKAEHDVARDDDSDGAM